MDTTHINDGSRDTSVINFLRGRVIDYNRDIYPSTTSSDLLGALPENVILFRGFPAQPAYCVSPFPTKLEFHLRHARLPYQVEKGSSTAAPKGKVPYVDLSALQGPDSSPSTHFGDSTLIFRRLVDIGQLEDLNANLSEEQKMTDLGIRALLEDKLYFCNV